MKNITNVCIDIVKLIDNLRQKIRKKRT